MDKPKKAHTNRLRLDIEPKLPSIYALERQLEEARIRRGCLIELPWMTDKPAQFLILSCEWGVSESLPLWTLAEQTGQESKIVWSRAYAPADMQVLYEAVSACETSTNPVNSHPLPVYDSSWGTAPAVPQPVSGTAFGGVVPPTPLYPYPQIPAHPQPGYSYPYYSYPFASVAPEGMVQATPWPTDMGWAYPREGQSVSNLIMNTPQMPVDYELISKQAKIQLGKLLRLAGLIAEPTLQAALKVQELVEGGFLSQEEAPSKLARYHMKGGEITSFVCELETNDIGNSEKVQSGYDQSPPQLKGPFDFLLKTGVLTDNDIETAQTVKARFGGDLVQILQSAGKLHQLAFDAAKICLPLIREGLMKMDDCKVAVMHCQQNQVEFDAALDQLSWPNPRKIRKDLQL